MHEAPNGLEAQPRRPAAHGSNGYDRIGPAQARESALRPRRGRHRERAAHHDESGALHRGARRPPGGRPAARVLLEASTESEWVARHLEGPGHEVVAADPNFAPMYATRSRRVKTDRHGPARTGTDRRDARTLA